MILRITILSLAALSLSEGSLFAQTPAAEPPTKKTTLIDSLKKAIDGNKDKVSGETRQKAEAAARAAMAALPDDLKKKAQDMASDPKAAEVRQKALQTVQGAMQSRETPPAAESPTETKPATPLLPVGPQPQRLQPLQLDDRHSARQAKTGRTEITATKSAYFDANTGIGIYRGSVRARHPNAYIECEELEIHMQKQTTGPDSKKKVSKAGDSDILASRSEKKAAGAPTIGGQESGIDIAYARGTMITIEKFDEDGELQIGHCNEIAIYEGKTGNITLRGWPSVQRGSKLLEATDPRCVIVIDQAGRLKADGGVFRTTLIDEKAADAAAAGSQPPPPTPAVPVRP